MKKILLLSLAACGLLLYTAPAMASPYPPGSPQPECVNYDPNTPPPGWPQSVVPWESMAGMPPELRCNLTPPLVNINASQAFDAYQSQEIDGGEGVLIIDVRTPEELYWVGVPAQVNSIEFENGNTVIPDDFRAELVPAILSHRPQYIKYKKNGKTRYKSVRKIAKTNLTGIVYNVPVEFRDPSTGERLLNKDFGRQVDALIRELQPSRVIFYCRSGKRSSVGCYYEFCPFEQLFPGVLSGNIVAYEVETQEINGLGGFESSSGSDRYLGYRGFPGRVTDGILSAPSASFKDAGLPIIISKLPKTVKVDSVTGATIELDSLDAPPFADQ